MNNMKYYIQQEKRIVVILSGRRRSCCQMDPDFLLPLVQREPVVRHIRQQILRGLCQPVLEEAVGQLQLVQAALSINDACFQNRHGMLVLPLLQRFCLSDRVVKRLDMRAQRGGAGGLKKLCLLQRLLLLDLPLNGIDARAQTLRALASVLHATNGRWKLTTHAGRGSSVQPMDTQVTHQLIIDAAAQELRSVDGVDQLRLADNTAHKSRKLRYQLLLQRRQVQSSFAEDRIPLLAQVLTCTSVVVDEQLDGHLLLLHHPRKLLDAGVAVVQVRTVRATRLGQGQYLVNLVFQRSSSSAQARQIDVSFHDLLRDIQVCRHATEARREHLLQHLHDVAGLLLQLAGLATVGDCIGVHVHVRLLHLRLDLLEGCRCRRLAVIHIFKDIILPLLTIPQLASIPRNVNILDSLRNFCSRCCRQL
eukprot:m.138342 g.138342  ORF g.138342 m.138342 type:complete len:420 (-) comp16628_c0_seq7:791-2050(-)